MRFAICNLQSQLKLTCDSDCEFIILVYMHSSMMKVSLDLVKSLYAKFIDWDDQMVDLETGTRSHAAK